MLSQATLNAIDVAQAVPLPPILSSRIPLDVYEEIIDWMDQPTLAAAALVDTAWHTRAMDNLYSTILIDSRASFDLLVKQARTSPRVRRWLTATRGLIVTHIVISRTYWHNRKYATVPGLFLHALPASLGQTMPGLRTLTIGFGLYPFMHPTFFHALPLFKHVVSLRLLDVWLSNIAQLHRIVYAFPQLESLSLFSGSLKEMYPGARSQRLALPPPNPRHASNIRLKKLVIDTCDDQHTLERMIDWLVQSEICANLHDLTVKYWWVKPHYEEQHDTSELVNQLLRRSGPHLVRFCEIAGSRPHVSQNILLTAISRTTQLCGIWRSLLRPGSKENLQTLCRRGRLSCFISSTRSEATSSSASQLPSPFKLLAT
ncbi:hypothetical protein DAEQUDRAFT_206267 [Daedalea quercina L-15889]|uniref:F-box domain-containing protein n=1 Tax=Daedalea quercina L-15889 TaxID=1314783 RepID=A0A165R8E6_9APHY|nr:hypothetical protein DAEQUDRAFT_206267 [Daedalea quercina L-15889]